jgi:predicted nucleotidyltransferase
MERLAERLASIPGVVAVTLGGSRALGTSRPDSDWDFGLYCRVGLMDAQSLLTRRTGAVALVRDVREAIDLPERPDVMIPRLPPGEPRG